MTCFLLQNSYGQHDKTHIVRSLYSELKIAQEFNKVEDYLYDEIGEAIEDPLMYIMRRCSAWLTPASSHGLCVTR